jgi:hypothetical protein
VFYAAFLYLQLKFVIFLVRILAQKTADKKLVKLTTVSIFACIFFIGASQAFAMSTNLWLSKWSDANTIKANSGRNQSGFKCNNIFRVTFAQQI